ncbi:hypothetical protein ABIA32_001288 [Streptacidiphilus sp. MAP12-20]|uniref:SHOCT domain-containing protein n=1 Tax=Streptacidiphilus sp. MAP12-20 TaxID=3156299 RepID=UPI003517E0EA
MFVRPMRPVLMRRPVGAPLLRGALIATPLTNDVASKLAQLGEMVQQGVLTREEFTAAKARLLS